jgi:type IV pilus biogenesis protein PilP
MKTAFNTIGLPCLRAFALLVAFGTAQSSALAASPADNAPAPVAPPAAPPPTASNDTISNLATSAAAVAPTTAPAPVAAPIAAPPPAPVVDAATDAATDKGGKTLDDEETSVPKSVNAVIRHLDKESENITLNDLNSARQAIAKIEALIELEKKLAELEKVQKERENKSSVAISASMLMPPTTIAPPPDMTKFMPPPASMTSNIDIDRITGGGGDYKAVIKTPEGTVKTVAIGDTLPDGGIVSKISSAGMEITHGENKQTVHVKNVDMVFGGSP